MKQNWRSPRRRASLSRQKALPHSGARPSPVSKRKKTRPLEAYILPNGLTVNGWWHKDVTSPDGKRFECSTFNEFRVVKNYLRQLAGGYCERCTPLHFIGDAGHPHHDREKKMGGGFVDDRIVVAGTRQLWWVCFDWHQDEHDGRHA